MILGEMDRYQRLGSVVARLIMDVRREGNAEPGDQPASQEDLEDLFAKTGAAIRDRFGKPVLPGTSDTVAVCPNCPKSGALFFDRVWFSPSFEDPPPGDIGAYGATDVEIVILSLAHMLQGIDVERVDTEEIPSSTRDDFRSLVPKALGSPIERCLANALNGRMGRSVTPVYSSSRTRDEDYKRGDRATLVWTIKNISLVREDGLEWSQVQEIRNDAAARTKLRRLLHWLDSEMVGQPASFVEDRLVAKLDDYDWALKKHGIRCLTGVLSSIVDPRFLATGAATVAVLSLTLDQIVGALSGAALALARVTLEASKAMLDVEDARRSTLPEVAYLHELRKKLGD